MAKPRPQQGKPECRRRACLRAAALVYAPPLHSEFGTASLGPLELAFLAPFALVVLGADELRRAHADTSRRSRTTRMPPSSVTDGLAGSAGKRGDGVSGSPDALRRAPGDPGHARGKEIVMSQAPRARVGDLVIVHGHRLGEPSRMGEILDVLGGP